MMWVRVLNPTIMRCSTHHHGVVAEAMRRAFYDNNVWNAKACLRGVLSFHKSKLDVASEEWAGVEREERGERGERGAHHAGGAINQAAHRRARAEASAKQAGRRSGGSVEHSAGPRRRGRGATACVTWCASRPATRCDPRLPSPSPSASLTVCVRARSRNVRNVILRHPRPTCGRG